MLSSYGYIYKNNPGVKIINRQVQIHGRSLVKRFDNQGDSRIVFENLDFEIQEQEFVCLLGPSGCGKTTLLRAIAGLEKTDEGEVEIQVKENGETAEIGMIFQDQGLFPWMTVNKNLSFVLENNPKIPAAEIQPIVENYLSEVGLAEFGFYYPHQLSGGMKQRVTIARAFANRPDILLMDEPFVFLDYQTRLRLQLLLLSLWQAHKKTVLFVTHDIDEAVLLADRVIVLSAVPASIKEIIDINLPRPRDFLEIRKTPEYLHYMDRIAGQLKVEMQFSGTV